MSLSGVASWRFASASEIFAGTTGDRASRGGKGWLAAAFAGAAIGVGLLAAAGPAEARGRRHHHHAAVEKRHRPAASETSDPRFAALIVDANTGKTLYARNEGELRHPASLTKVMTLYLLFEQLQRGRLRLDSELKMSSRCAGMAPSKLGVAPGRAIEAEDAIKALVTKSANDVACAIGENIGGSEERFAELMTRKARALGMSRTVYRNASGLPNTQQVTSARDLSILGRAVQTRFPKYYRYFSTRTFYYAGRPIKNHNHLLGRVEGVDGIKTGYTAASGFNLLTSVKRDGRHIVGVVMGGRTGAVRDRIMADLIASNLEAGSRARTALAMAEAPEEADADAPDGPALSAEPARPVVAEAAPQVEPRAEPRLLAAAYAPAAEEAAAPIPAARPAARPLGLQLLTPPAPPSQRQARPAYVASARPAAVDRETATGSIARPSEARASTTTPSASREARSLAAVEKPAPAEKATLRAASAAPLAPAPKEGRTTVARTSETAAQPAYRPGWIIQIGATEDAAKAQELLERARARSRSVAGAQLVTEKVQKGAETLWRARFAGMQQSAALSACADLKKSGFNCFALRN